MNIFYEESGQFKVATIIQKNDSTYQVDTQHGKRTKVKANSVFVEFNDPLESFINAAQAEAQEIDTQLLWEVCGEDEFTAQDIAAEYFGGQPSKIQLAATLMALYAAPMYFHKKNKGVFKAAPAEILQQALAAIERKQQQEQQVQNWVEQLLNGGLPSEIQQDLKSILHTPDKQSLTYKAFKQAADTMKLNAYELAKQVGGITSLPEYLLQRFECKYFPKGTDFPNIAAPVLPEHLPIAENIRAFSIDDKSTTEVDDALSVQDLGNGIKKVGIHIAAPSLSIDADSEMEKIVMQRLSTVYFPANKITMLPENWISQFSLDEGKYCPAFSVYFHIDENYQIIDSESKIEQVWIENNLRIHAIEPFFNSETGVGTADNPQFPHHAEILYLLDLAHELQKQRDRYEENPPKKYDYSIDFDENGKVLIVKRERGSPIDTVVSEMMILANSHWAQVLDEHEMGGLFRVQPSGRVRMSTHSEKHIGMNLNHYAWFTSPLRRACDYINQKQLQSVLMADCAPRYEKNDSMLFVALNQFESAYTAYREFQDMMEHYWAMVYLLQENIQEIQATVLKEDLVRLEGVPLVARALGIPTEIAPKATVRVAITHIDTEQQLISLKYLNVVAVPEPEAIESETA